MRYVLGIESSCDETAAAVFSPKTGICSNELFSQIALHAQYGGVMPEVASRSHIEKIDIITSQALQKAEIELNEVDLIAVTNGPGLPGSLLVGLCFAKSIAYAKNIPIIGINHIHAHALSPAIENAIPFPYLCITASGGHTSLSLVHNMIEQETIATTRDDAAGEAFDKVAKLLGLGYPGGPIIEQLAKQANFIDHFSYPRNRTQELFFSFSGLKTAVLYHILQEGWYDKATKTFLPKNDSVLKEKIASSFLCAVSDMLTSRIKIALERHPEIQAVAFAGGVACNNYLKKQIKNIAEKYKQPFFAPQPQYCTDNAAMVAFAGYQKSKITKLTQQNLQLDLLRR